VTAAAALLAACAARGIALQVDGDRLRYRCPRGALPPELRAELIAHRAALVAMLASPPGRVPLEKSKAEVRLQPNLLRVQRHVHSCTRCSRRFRCTAPSCAGQPKRCICCTVDVIGERNRR
jgi:TubC N-terminal docking domain